MSKSKRMILYVIRACFVALAIFFFIWILVDPNYHKWGGVLAGLGLPFLMPVIEKLLKIRIPFRIQMIYYIFLFVALSLGISFDLYKNVPFYDKIVHGASGALSAIVGYYGLVYFKANKKPKFFQFLFIFGICMTIAVLWEFFEFSCDKFLGQHMQTLVSDGVDDTMFDLLSAIIGSVFGGILFTRTNFVKNLEK